MARALFQELQNIEVVGKPKGMLGTFYEAKILDFVGSEHVNVEYAHLVEKYIMGKLTERLHISRIRPTPPNLNKAEYAIGDDIDVRTRDGYWHSVVTEWSGSKYYVSFPFYNERRRSFTPQNLRPHQEWVYDVWRSDQGFCDVNGLYKEGDVVEVIDRKKRQPGTFHYAVVKQVIHNTYLRVEYMNLFEEDKQTKIQETFYFCMIRPTPPPIGMIDKFDRGEPLDLEGHFAFHKCELVRPHGDDSYLLNFPLMKNERA